MPRIKRSLGEAQVKAQRSYVVRRLLVPAQRFIQTETVGGVFLFGAAAIALLWANSRWGGSYTAFFRTPLQFHLGFFSLSRDVQHWVNDGLMTIFFFVVGLEIKRELVEGALSQWRQAALPTFAAIGGMIVPVLIYLWLNLGESGARGWGIPMATDIAFALGALALVGAGIPPVLRILLLSLAIADDIGAILVIALAYTDALSWTPIAIALAIYAVIVAYVRFGIRRVRLYGLLGFFFWLAVLQSGVHATIAGVILGLTAPHQPDYDLRRFADELSRLASSLRNRFEQGREEEAEELLGQIEELTVATEPLLDRFLRRIHPWSTFVVLPIFALANSGVVFSGGVLAGAMGSEVSRGVLLGLWLGKPLGVFGFAWVAVKLGIARLPDGVRWSHILGLGMLAGIGFTVSLFISDIAFDVETTTAHAKIGIIAASLLAGVAGILYLRLVGRRPI
ncbi:MAG: Na+/H+ antiporter NhaA [Gemmatimonadetes bacterium]|nr:Na+/H+ antiporter NhaA [Gemmatimonadota bacterium]